MAQGNKKAKTTTPFQKPKQKGKSFTRKASKNIFQFIYVCCVIEKTHPNIFLIRCPNSIEKGKIRRKPKTEADGNEKCEQIG